MNIGKLKIIGFVAIFGLVAGCAIDPRTGRIYVEPEVAGAGLGAAIGAAAGNPGLGAAVGAGAGHLTRYSRYGQNWQPDTRLEYQYQTPPVPDEESCTSAYTNAEQQINSAVTRRRSQAVSYRAITRDGAGAIRMEQDTTRWQASSLQSARGQFESCVGQIGVAQPQRQYSQPIYRERIIERPVYQYHQPYYYPRPYYYRPYVPYNWRPWGGWRHHHHHHRHHHWRHRRHH